MRKPRAVREPPPTSVWARIQEHKVLQWSLAYLGAALALAHGQELVGHTFHWPAIIGRLLMGVLIVGFPIAVVLAWFHGHKKMKHISAGEMTTLAVLLLAGGAVLTLLARSGHESEVPEAVASAQVSTVPSVTTPMAPNRVRLAILPFENLSPDPANAFFTDGMHEEVLSALAQRVPTLDVISRTTMMTYRRAPKPTKELAKELNVTHVLEGSVRREVNQVRLTLQLIDAQRDTRQWSQSYDRTLANALSLQSDVAGEVAKQLSVQLAGGPRGGPPTRDPEAYDSYLKARLAAQLISPYQSIKVFHEVEASLDAAIGRDPTFGLAYAERAGLNLLKFIFNHDTSEPFAARIRSDLEEARRLSGDHPSVLAAEGQYLSIVEQEHERALESFRAAEARGLADSSGLQAEAFVLFRLGHLDEALRLDERLIALDPANPFLLSSLAAHRVMMRQPAEALRIIDLGLERSPEFVSLQMMRAGIVASGSGTSSLLSTPSGPFVEDAAVRLEQQFSALRMQRRYEDLQRLLDGVSEESVRVAAGGLSGIAFGVGVRPVAEYRGWLALLRGAPKEEVRKHGRTVLSFVADQKETKWNRWFLRSLAAEGHLFLGDTTRAREAATETLVLTPRSKDLFAWYISAIVAARVHAWGGDGDSAVAILEQLGTETPGLPAAGIVLDPFYEVPLARNARYQALVARLKPQMTR